MTNLPAKYRENIFKKIFNFFRNKYRKNIDQPSIVSINHKTDDLVFKEDLQKEYNIIKSKETIIEEIINNPELIYVLSEDKLEKAINIFDEKILELENDIHKLDKELMAN